MIDYLRIPEPDIHGRNFFGAVREGLWPFKATEIVCQLQYDIDYARQKVIVEAHFDNCFFTVEVDLDRDAMMDSLDAEVLRISREIVRELRYRPYIDSDHHKGEE